MTIKSTTTQKVNTILRSAKGFGSISRISVEKLINNFNDWGVYLPVAVVNTTFCIELLLKAVHLLNNNKVTGHDLSKLFRNLPKVDRNNIEVVFKKNRGATPPFQGAGHIYTSTLQNTPVTIDLGRIAYSLEDVFSMHENSFVTFRYVHDVPVLFQTYYFEQEILTTLIESLFEYIETKMR